MNNVEKSSETDEVDVYTPASHNSAHFHFVTLVKKNDKKTRI